MTQNNNVLVAAIESKKDQDHFLEALSSIRINAKVKFVNSHDQLKDLLSASPGNQDINDLNPNLILVVAELNDAASLPLIKDLKAIERVKKIPLVIVSKHHDEQQLRTAYRLGAASVIKHPSHFESMIKILQILDEYWFNTVKLPSAIN